MRENYIFLVYALCAHWFLYAFLFLVSFKQKAKATICSIYFYRVHDLHYDLWSVKNSGIYSAQAYENFNCSLSNLILLCDMCLCILTMYIVL